MQVVDAHLLRIVLKIRSGNSLLSSLLLSLSSKEEGTREYPIGILYAGAR